MVRRLGDKARDADNLFGATNAVVILENERIVIKEFRDTLEA